MTRPPIRGPADFAAAIDVSRETLERLEVYAGLLVRWQRITNLIAPNSVPELWHRHFLDSAQLLRLVPAEAKALADLGSGAGFPGLVLALCRTAPTRVELYESDSRKAAFLRTVIRETGAPAEVREGRIETLARPGPDVLTARALAPLPELLALLERFWRPGTIAILPKGRNLRTEIEACSAAWDFAYHLEPSVTDSASGILVLRSLARVRAVPP